jgi:hypothetical protein
MRKVPNDRSLLGVAAFRSLFFIGWCLPLVIAVVYLAYLHGKMHLGTIFCAQIPIFQSYRSREGSHVLFTFGHLCSFDMTSSRIRFCCRHADTKRL